MAAAVVLLVITCGNLAALLLGEGVTREAEVRTRLALGATPARIVRQLVAESAILAIAGGLVGVAVAAGLSKALLAFAPTELPHANEIGLSARSLLAVSLLTAGVASLRSASHRPYRWLESATAARGSRAVSRRRSRPASWC